MSQFSKRMRWAVAVGGALFIVFQASFLLAAFTYDDDGDCDVDGVDLHRTITQPGGITAGDVPGFAGQLGSVGTDCDVIGVGTPIDGYPEWHERTLMVFTNLARLAPTDYRDTFMAGFTLPPGGILNDRFPAVPPLYSAHALNRSARYHARDMALNCDRLQHASCDGTDWDDRIYSFYPTARRIGENVAYTSNVNPSRPWYIVSLFLCDAVNGVCAGDDQPSYIIGHRENIMSAGFTEIGSGYGAGSSAYWVQDFNGIDLVPQPPIAAASHANIDTGSTTFYLNYYDETGAQPQEIEVVLDNQSHALFLGWGAAGAGTYQTALPEADECRAYHFQVTAADGLRYRYPGSGSFHTFGEGGCSLDYVSP